SLRSRAPFPTRRSSDLTVGFEGDHESIDEINYATQTAKILGLDHSAVRIGYSDFLQSLPKIADIVEEPIGTTSIIPMYYLSQLRSEEHTSELQSREKLV